jgi:hypothetical protein
MQDFKRKDSLRPLPAERSGTLEKWKLAAISVFLLFHIVVIFCWSVPLNSLLVTAVKESVRPYMHWAGLFQVWDMFSPNPLNLNTYLEAELTFRDGSTRVWKFPKMQELGYVERYFKERYRKFGNERVRLDANSALWPDAARYIARINNNPSNPPTVVRLVRYWSEIAPPTADGSHPPEPWHHFVFFIHFVSAGDLS